MSNAKEALDNEGDLLPQYISRRTLDVYYATNEDVVFIKLQVEGHSNVRCLCSIQEALKTGETHIACLILHIR